MRKMVKRPVQATSALEKVLEEERLALTPASPKRPPWYRIVKTNQVGMRLCSYNCCTRCHSSVKNVSIVSISAVICWVLTIAVGVFMFGWWSFLVALISGVAYFILALSVLDYTDARAAFLIHTPSTSLLPDDKTLLISHLGKRSTYLHDRLLGPNSSLANLKIRVTTKLGKARELAAKGEGIATLVQDEPTRALFSKLTDVASRSIPNFEKAERDLLEHEARLKAGIDLTINHIKARIVGWFDLQGFAAEVYELEGEAAALVEEVEALKTTSLIEALAELEALHESLAPAIDEAAIKLFANSESSSYDEDLATLEHVLERNAALLPATNVA